MHILAYIRMGLGFGMVACGLYLRGPSHRTQLLRSSGFGLFVHAAFGSGMHRGPDKAC